MIPDYPKYTPKSVLTLSAAPEHLPVPSEPLTELRTERDPITPGLLAEQLDALTAQRRSLDRRITENLATISESELRALWGDR